MGIGLLVGVLGVFVLTAVAYAVAQLVLRVGLRDARARKIAACCVVVPLLIGAYAWGVSGDGAPPVQHAIALAAYVASGALLLALDLAYLRRREAR